MKGMERQWEGEKRRRRRTVEETTEPPTKTPGYGPAIRIGELGSV